MSTGGNRDPWDRGAVSYNVSAPRFTYTLVAIALGASVLPRCGLDVSTEGLQQFVSLWLDFFTQHAEEVLPVIDPFTLEVPLVLSRLMALSPPPNASAFLSSLRCSPQDLLQAMGCALHALLLLPQFSSQVPAASAVAAAAITEEAVTAVSATLAELPAEAAELAGLTGGCPIVVTVRLIDLEAPISFGSLRSNQPLVQRLAFECAKCGSRTVKLLTDGRVQEVATSPESSYQGESPEEAARPLAGGIRPAATIDCELTGFLVGQCKPGDRVCITGIVQACQSSAVSAHLANPHAVDGGRLGGSKSLYTLYLRANSVSPLDRRVLLLQLQQHRKRCARHRETPRALLPLPATVARRPLPWRDFTASAVAQEDEDEAETARDCAFGAKADASAHAGEGQETDVAAAAAAQAGDRLMEFIADAYTLEPRRFELLVASIAPSIVGRHIVKAASAAGLTAAAVREAGTGELIIEAGALVLADGGVCCIDELDKMPAAAALTGDSASLLEAMEQQTVTIAKASCSCCLPARTTLLAAANPKEGRFDPRKPLAENINLSAPLLSRFDLIFLLHDKPAAAADARLAAHVFSSSHSKLHPAAAGIPAPPATASPTGESTGGTSCLEDRLMALEARARADLRQTATAGDARDVIEVYGHTPLACPSLLAQAAAATGCTDTSGNAAFAVCCAPAGRKPRKGLQGLVLAFARECAAVMGRTGTATLSQTEAMKCASLLVSRAQAAVPAEAVVAAANETGLLLKREGKWVIDRSLLAQF
ncbi:DNA replication licensing [Cyclospora cayetanensis]|uniref:DNA helicase n=1 Tax=Cyclospora cayetanensis TaxID=88456 RepID=A0A1D3CTA6_9EIME|nr:DNA replication licensing [Cyclospora cayetanensis]